LLGVRILIDKVFRPLEDAYAPLLNVTTAA